MPKLASLSLPTAVNWSRDLAVHVLLGAFAEVRKATVSLVLSVGLPFRMNNSAATRRIFIKFDVSACFKNLSRKFKCP